MAASPVFLFSPFVIHKVECINLDELQLEMANLIDLKEVFTNLALLHALYASSCPIRHVPGESARSAGEISMALKLSTL